MQLSDHRVIVLNPSDPALHAVAHGLGVKNIRNTTLFLARNVLSAYDWDKNQKRLVRRATLHPHQVAARETLAAVIARSMPTRNIAGCSRCCRKPRLITCIS